MNTRDLYQKQIENRLALVELLLMHNICPVKKTKYCAVDFIAEVAQMGSLELLKALEVHDFDMRLEDEDDFGFVANNLCEASRTEIISYLQNFI